MKQKTYCLDLSPDAVKIWLPPAAKKAANDIMHPVGTIKRDGGNMYRLVKAADVIPRRAEIIFVNGYLTPQMELDSARPSETEADRTQKYLVKATSAIIAREGDEQKEQKTAGINDTGSDIPKNHQFWMLTNGSQNDPHPRLIT